MTTNQEPPRPRDGHWASDSNGIDSEEGPGAFPYKRLWRNTVVLTAIVTLAPLIIMTVVNYYQYSRALQAEIRYPTSMLLSNSKRRLEFFIAERLAALRLVTGMQDRENLCEAAQLARTLRNIEGSFGGFVDLGLIESDGRQCAYEGPYKLTGKNYKDQPWFHEVSLRGEYVSDVFMGYRGVPHFVIAVRHEKPSGELYVLRATVGADVLRQFAEELEIKGTTDSFIVNREGMLQTPSHSHGELLAPGKVPIPPYRNDAELLDRADGDGDYLLGYAYIDRSPFVLVMIRRSGHPVTEWLSLRGEFAGFLLTSVVLIMVVIVWNTTIMVRRMRRADARRAQFLHNIEYTSKMASIGRLAAGVAHEINNPLAIINEKAGLLEDIAEMSEDFPKKKDVLTIVDSIANSVKRCSAITHRLLGFAKRMDVKLETMDMGDLLKEVVSFLGKEAEYRNISIDFHLEDDLPSVESDRGQLQQVFLNIINNAVAAVDDGGRIDIRVRQSGPESVCVRVEDDGKGISKADLEHIFEPFFTTKKEHGTGLGLSITWGIIEKLGGSLEVESELGKGTVFAVTLPLKQTKF